MIFENYADTIDYKAGYTAVGLSSLDRNIWNGSVKILDESGQILSTYRSNSGITALKFFDRIPELLVVAKDNGDIMLCRQKDNTESESVSGHSDCVSSLSFVSKNSTDLISVGWDSRVNIWSFSGENMTPCLLHSIDEAHYKRINDVASHPYQSSLFGTAGEDGFVRLWDHRCNMNSEGCSQIFNTEQPISCITWSSENESCFLTGNDDGSMNIFDIRCDPSSIVYKEKLHKKRIRKLINCDSIPGLLLSCSDDKSIAATRIRNINIDMNVDILDDPIAVKGTLKFQNFSRRIEHTDHVTDFTILEENWDEGLISILSASTDKTLKKTVIEIPKDE